MTEKRNNSTGRPWRRALLRAPFVLLIPLGLSLPRLATRCPDWIENTYARVLYPPIRDAIASVTSLVPFSVAELLLYACCAGIPLLVLFRLIRAFARRAWPRFAAFLLALGGIAGAMLCLFYVTWGFNYFRAPLSARMGLAVEARSVEELEALTGSLARRAASLREACHEDDDGVFALSHPVEASFRELVPAYATLAGREPAFSGKVTQAKPVLWSRGMSWAGIAGIYIGFTAEPNVNMDQPPLLVLAGAAHEMAHQLGIASENEAELASYLACIASTNPEIAYSGTMHALLACGNALYAADAERYLAVAQTYSEGMWRDLADYNAYWKAFEGPIEERATVVNDSYLKHNEQESGVKSYGEVVDLLLAYYDAHEL